MFYKLDLSCIRNHTLYTFLVAYLVFIGTTNTAFSSLVDITVSGNLSSNSSLPFSVRYRLDTSAEPVSTDETSSFWLLNPALNNPFLVEVEGNINDIDFSFSTIDLNSSNATQLLFITDNQPGDGLDSFWLGASANSSSSIIGVDFRITQQNGDSSLQGLAIPTTQSELDLNSFSTLEFGYRNTSGNPGTGEITSLSVSVVPAPNSSAIFGISLVLSSRRRR